jgi:hypothetical protein
MHHAICLCESNSSNRPRARARRPPREAEASVNSGAAGPPVLQGVRLGARRWVQLQRQCSLAPAGWA